MEVPTMIACSSPPSHHHPYPPPITGDADSSCMMMDYDDDDDHDDDCAISTLSFGANTAYNTPQRSAGSRSFSSRMYEAPSAPTTPTSSSFGTTKSSTTTAAGPSLTLSPRSNRRIATPPSLLSTSSSSLLSASSLSSPSANDVNVRVNVGGGQDEGSLFSFPSSVFQQQFFSLPWKTDIDGVFHLSNVSPAVFEVLLDYTLFGTLPAYDTLCDEEFQEFETIALSMMGRRANTNTCSSDDTTGNQAKKNKCHNDHNPHDLMRLIEHFDRKDSYVLKELRQGRKQQPRDSNYYVLNSENASPDSVAARFLGAICSVLPSRRPLATTGNGNSGSAAPDSTAKRLKLTHGQRCSSSQDLS